MSDHIISTFERLILPRIEINIDGCWLYTGSLLQSGYALFSVKDKSIYIHRASFEYHKYPIPDGLEIDHNCHKPQMCQMKNKCPHRRCINPCHLDAVTRQENMKRRRSYGEIPEWVLARTWPTNNCEHGHAFDLENTRFRMLRTGSWVRVCIQCTSRYYQEFKARKHL